MNIGRRHVYLEPRPLGEYVADVRVYDVLDRCEETDLSFTSTLDDLYTLQLHVGNAIRRIHERMTTDAVAGDCDRCGNTRMIYPIRHGHPTAEYCPTCHPKLSEWRSRISETTS